MLIRQDDPHARRWTAMPPPPCWTITLTAMAAMPGAALACWRQSLTHPALRAEGRALLPVLSATPARPPATMCLRWPAARSDENTPPSRFELDDPAYQRAYRLSALLEVRALLAEAVRQQALVRLYPDGEDAALNACWQALDEDHLSPAIAGSSHKPGSPAGGATVVADSTVSKIKVQFALLAPRFITMVSSCGYRRPLPDSVLRLQRRDHYRLKLGGPAACIANWHCG